MEKLGEVVGEGYIYDLEICQDKIIDIISISDGEDTLSISLKMVKELIEILKDVEK